MSFSNSSYPKFSFFFFFCYIICFHCLFLFLFSSDSGFCGLKRLASATSAAGTAVAASEAAGSSEVPTWAWTSSSWKSWHPPPRLHSLLPAQSQTCLMASPCCSLGSGLLPRKYPKWMVCIYKGFIWISWYSPELLMVSFFFFFFSYVKPKQD